MDENSLKKIIEQGETATVEFKSWVKAASMRERINLVVPELIQIIAESSVDDINLMVVYSLKEKLKLRDASSTLPELDGMAFLRDLGLTAEDNGKTKLTIAGLLFVGKDTSIQKLLPQAEVIYLHYDRENLEEYNARLDMKQPIIIVLDRLT